MPAFTIAASYIVASVGGITLAAAVGSAGLAFITSVVAVGLAYATANLLGLTGGSGGTAQDPGVRLQLPPATNNKVPIVYGSVNTKGTLSDARISNGNQTMTYVLQLSEKTQTGTFTLGNIYWNDELLVFKTGSSSHIVASSIDQNGTGATSTNFDGKIRIRVYSGSTDSSDQIFPPQAGGNIENARTLLGESDTDYLLTDLVFAVVQIDYNSEKGITGLGQVTWQLNNSLKNPGLVWYDYMTSARYGAGIPSDQIDTDTSTNASNPLSLYSRSNQVPDNQFESDGTTPSTQTRYEINGVLSTGATVKDNLTRISQGGAAWTTYDFVNGQWKIIGNRAATTEELAAAFVFDDDNLIGDVGITATNLEDLYSTLEVEYSSRLIRDQNDYYRAEINSSLRNNLEPDNTLSMRLDLANNALHAARIGLIELKQSRVDLIITFRADYSAIGVEAGDVVKVTNDVYGFTQKLFRVTKAREVEDEGGGLTIEITALEYDPDVYLDETLVDQAETPGSGIPVFGGSSSLLAPSAPEVIAITTGTSPSFTLATTIDAGSGPVDEIQWFYSTNSGTSYSYLTNEYSIGGTYGAGTVVEDTITILGAGTYYFKARAGLGAQYGDLSTDSDEFIWNPSGI